MSIYNSFKFKILIIIVIIIALFDLCFAKSQGSQLTTGFIRDNQGTLFYYDEDNYCNDGWHLIDDNGDGIYEYYYFSLSGHLLKDTTTPNGYKLNSNGKLIINDVVYQVSFLDVANSDVAIFLNKKESVDELTKGFETDYNQVFNEWYIKSKTDITSQLNAIANNLTVQKVNKVRDEVSRRVKECKKLSVTGSLSKGEQIKNMLNTRFGTAPAGSKVRLISMRIYDKYFADYEYSKTSITYDPETLNWWTRIRDNFELDSTRPPVERLFSEGKSNIIVEYHPRVCDCNTNHNSGG